MFTIDELIIREGESVSDLIEDRARSFCSNHNQMPDTAHVSPDVFSDLLKQAAYNNQHSYANPPIGTGRGVSHVSFESSFGTIKFRLVKNLKQFMLVGKERTFDDFDFKCGIPREFWTERYSKYVDEQIDDIIFRSESP